MFGIPVDLMTLHIPDQKGAVTAPAMTLIEAVKLMLLVEVVVIVQQTQPAVRQEDFVHTAQEQMGLVTKMVNF